MYLCKVKCCNQELADKIINKDSHMDYAGVVSGNNYGEVWVNDVINPTFVLVWSEYLSCFHFMGTSYDNINVLDLRNFIDTAIHKFLKDKSIDFFEFACDKESWLPFILKVLSNHKVKSGGQYVYRLDNNVISDDDVLFPDGYEYLDINTGFLKNTIQNFSNFDMIRTEINKSWYSVNSFMKFGKGFVATQNNEICSFALTHFRYQDTYSIGIETFDPNKQKGLSSSLVKLLIRRIVAQGGNVWWDCMESNIASQKTAQKSSLIFDHKYECYWFDF